MREQIVSDRKAEAANLLRLKQYEKAMSELDEQAQSGGWLDAQLPRDLAYLAFMLFCFYEALLLLQVYM